jgi:hypothetical protein
MCFGGESTGTTTEIMHLKYYILWIFLGVVTDGSQERHKYTLWEYIWFLNNILRKLVKFSKSYALLGVLLILISLCF